MRIATPVGQLPGDSDAATGAKKLPKDPIPPRYNVESTLEFDVPAGGTAKADFKLTSP